MFGESDNSILNPSHNYPTHINIKNIQITHQTTANPQPLYFW